MTGFIRVHDDTATHIDLEFTDTNSDKNSQCKGQGVANNRLWISRRHGGCAMIGQSVI